jgi:hypothetical protein
VQRYSGEWQTATVSSAMHVESTPGGSPRAMIPRQEWHNRHIPKRASANRKPQRSRKPGMKSSPCLRTRHAMSTAGRHLTFTETALCARIKTRQRSRCLPAVRSDPVEQTPFLLPTKLKTHDVAHRLQINYLTKINCA